MMPNRVLLAVEAMLLLEQRAHRREPRQPWLELERFVLVQSLARE